MDRTIYITTLQMKTSVSVSGLVQTNQMTIFSYYHIKSLL